jgi:hypothetical protein
MNRVRALVGLDCASSAPMLMTNHGTGAAETSSGTYSGTPFDMHRYKGIFPDRWASFLRAHFRDSRHVAYAFSVDDKTARNWLAGITAPRAEAALMAVSTYPDALPLLMGAA